MPSERFDAGKRGGASVAVVHQAIDNNWRKVVPTTPPQTLFRWKIHGCRSESGAIKDALLRCQIEPLSHDFHYGEMYIFAGRKICEYRN